MHRIFLKSSLYAKTDCFFYCRFTSDVNSVTLVWGPGSRRTFARSLGPVSWPANGTTLEIAQENLWIITAVSEVEIIFFEKRGSILNYLSFHLWENYFYCLLYQQPSSTQKYLLLKSPQTYLEEIHYNSTEVPVYA